jgi:hypothetical protein
MNTLSEISKKYPTDKDFTHNYYNSVYEDAFKDMRENVKLLCEIGIGGFWKEVGWVPGNSLKVWRDYFPNAKVLGLDINLHEITDSERISLEWLDQSKRDLVIEYSRKLENYDVIIDDGSHNVYDQQITLAYFFRSLKSGGIYVLEDLHSSEEVEIPEKAKMWGWGVPGYVTPLELLDQFENHNNFNVGISKPYSLTENELKYLEDNIKSVKVFRVGPTSITSVIIKK